jgi:hypothetical protein
MSYVYQLIFEISSDYTYLMFGGVYSSIEELVRCEDLKKELLDKLNNEVLRCIESGSYSDDLTEEVEDMIKIRKFEDITEDIHVKALELVFGGEEIVKFYEEEDDAPYTKIHIVRHKLGFEKSDLFCNIHGYSLLEGDNCKVSFLYHTSKRVFDTLTSENFDNYEVGKQILAVYD